MIAPIVEDIAGEFGAKAKVLKMDIDANPQTPISLGDTDHSGHHTCALGGMRRHKEIP